MNVEYTGRQFEITPGIRKEVETGLAKIKKILGDKFDCKIILSVEKHHHKAEITITPRNGPLVGLAQATSMKAAIREALEHLSRQAIKYKTRRVAKKRHDRKNWSDKGPAEERSKVAVGLPRSTPVPVLVHKFPVVEKSTDVQLVRSDDSVAIRPMTLEEAIKEAQFRDREVFVFRDLKGKLLVLHRKRDGKMELIEAP